MNIYYLPNGEIWNAILKSDVPSHEIEPSASIIEVDLIPENKELVKDMLENSLKRNIQGLGRWYVENGELFERDGWQEMEY